MASSTTPPQTDTSISLAISISFLAVFCYFFLNFITYLLKAIKETVMILFLHEQEPEQGEQLSQASSSSSPSLQMQMQYQVFLSFRGEDTRHNFTAHLLKALKDRGMNVFFDEHELERGEPLAPALSRAIAASNLSIIILSIDYASSKSCLAELRDIMSRRDEPDGHIVLPIFYHVDPSDVRNLGGSFKTSFEEHESKGYGQQWKKAFTESGKLKGWHIEGGKFDRSETTYIDDIVEYVIKKLDSKSISVSEGLVGIDDQKKTILRLVEQEENRVIGLWGMGGIGKTTLAEAVYNEISLKFDARWFLQNVREKIEKQGMESIRNELLSKLLKSVTCIDTPSIGSTLTQQRLNNKRVIVVLDDVSDSDQIVDMGTKHFGPGSKIIVTSRDKQELENGGADITHKVEMLNEKDSLQLFSTFAFKQLNPAAEFIDLSYKFVGYAQGSPLALKVLGSQLYKKSRQFWESEVFKLREYAKPKISQVLERSFYGLDELEKNIFLDIAILVKRNPKEEVEAFLGSCYKEGAVSAISRLLDKCLLEIVTFHEEEEESYECISMHDMLEEMGKYIESKDPGNRRRFWTRKDVVQTLRYNKWSDSVEGIKLDANGIDNRWLCPTVFQNMHSLRFIKLDLFNEELNELGVDIASLPDELRYLQWDYYPFKSLSSGFNPSNLVVLKLRGGNMEQLWKEDHQDLVNLREIDVSDCMRLRKIPNLSSAVNLKFLNCNGCLSLVELSCLNYLESLEEFHLSHCVKLRAIPDLSGAINLKILYCVECKSLVELSGLSHLASLEKLDLDFCESLRNIPDLSGAINLKHISCYLCKSLVELPCLNHLALLEKLNLFRCCSLKKFPEVPSHFHELDLSNAEIEQVPDSIEHLIRLERLNMSSSKVKLVSSNISKLESLRSLDLSRCPVVEFPKIPTSLTELDLSGTQIEQVSLSLDCPSNLRDLNISRCSSIQKLQCNIALPGSKEIPTPDVPSPTLDFNGLQVLRMYGCTSLKLLSDLPPYLQCMDAHGCRSLENVSFTDQHLYRLDSLGDDEDELVMFFSNCFSLNHDSVDNIETDALLKIGYLAEKSARENANYPKKVICCFPGNKISEDKFEGQSESCLVVLKIAPNERGERRFLAFAMCLVADLMNRQRVTAFICNYQLRAVGGEEFSGECQVKFTMPRKIEGDHVLILYSPDMIKIDKDYEEASFQFYIRYPRFGEEYGGRYVKVEKCGVHVFYVDAESDAKTEKKKLKLI